ncbi:testis development-related protein-like isoform X11 [Stegostoma tigrinum]|uniref:testis development-related protein-like isoform X11 n=1 Tax=Stegostoma tigrinum TaxID=3053191 RepID=UPI00202AFFB9|nr:testis development-related protein-like isoform X11 [Stegostoma tigrinum]
MWRNKHKGLKDSDSEDDKPQEVSKSKDPLLPEETTSSVSQLATKNHKMIQDRSGHSVHHTWSSSLKQVQGASLKGWKEVTSLFNKDDEHKLLTDSEPKWTTVKLKEEVKMEKKSSFWDSLGIKQNSASKIPTEDEVWDPQVKVENPCSGLTDSSTWSDWASETCGSSKYTSLDSETNTGGSKWSIMTAGKLPGIRRRSKGNLTDCWEEIE